MVKKAGAEIPASEEWSFTVTYTSGAPTNYTATKSVTETANGYPAVFVDHQHGLLEKGQLAPAALVFIQQTVDGVAKPVGGLVTAVGQQGVPAYSGTVAAVHPERAGRVPHHPAGHSGCG